MASRLLHEFKDVLDPRPWVDGPTVGQTLLQHNQSARFNSKAAMLHYICEDNEEGPSAQGSTPQWYFVPVCEFPYINKGWNDDGEPGMDDVVFNDCSITLSQAISGYNNQCVIMVIIALIPLLLSLVFLKGVNDKKKPKDRNKRWFLPANPNVTEQLLLLGILLGFAHCIRCIDVLGYANRLRIDTIYTMSTATCVSAPFHGAFILIRSWVTIVDGGKSKRCPRWCKIYCAVGIYFTYIVEIVGGFMEYRWQGAEVNVGAISGEMNSLKMMNGTIWAGSLTIIMFSYGQRIANQLKSGSKEPTPQFKKIKKMCRIASLLLGFGTMVKFSGIFVRNFQVCQMVTPCGGGSPQVMIPAFIYMFQYGITIINQPTSRGKKATTRAAEKVIGKKIFESTASSTDSDATETDVSSSSSSSDTAKVTPAE